MTALEMKKKFIDRIASGDWSLQEFPGKYAAPSMLWLLIWMFDNWDPEIESFVSNFFNPYEFYGWLNENLPQLIEDWEKDVDAANEESCTID